MAYISAGIRVQDKVIHMNPSNPTTHEMRTIERLFHHQMQALTLGRPSFSSFDYQCSDRWC